MSDALVTRLRHELDVTRNMLDATNHLHWAMAMGRDIDGPSLSTACGRFSAAQEQFLTLAQDDSAAIEQHTGLVAENARLKKALRKVEQYKWPVSAGKYRETFYGEATGNEYSLTHHIPKESASQALERIKLIARAALDHPQGEDK